MQALVAQFANVTASTTLLLILVFAGHLLRGVSASRDDRFIGILRVLALLGLAAVVGLRANQTGRSLLMTLAPACVVAFAGGFAIRRSRLEGLGWFQSSGDPMKAISVVAGVMLLVALPALAARVAEHWDTSGFMDSQTYDRSAMNILTGRTPLGNSDYMPAYQYGLASLYYIWGHVFFVAQLANIVLASLAVVALGWTAWLLFRSRAAAVVAALFAALSPPLLYAVHTTQIESWFLPLTALILLLWARYLQDPTWQRIAYLGVALGAGMNLRNQGAVFFAFMCLAPCAIPRLRWRTRLSHSVIAAATVAVCLLPWSVRNYHIEDRFSPSASRSVLYLGVLSDHRIGLYGIRYWEGWDEVAAEFIALYPEPAARESALIRAAFVNTFSDPVWLARAFAWRTLSYYGLLPDGYLSVDSLQRPEWRAEWRKYVFARIAALVTIPLSIVALTVRPSAMTFFLGAGILAMLSINLVSATSEERIGYPALLVHVLLVAALFTRPRSDGEAAVPVRIERHVSAKWPFVIASVAAVVITSRVMWGKAFTYRPLTEQTVTFNPQMMIDATYPLLEGGTTGRASGVIDHTAPQRVRLHAMLTNYLYPPRFAGRVPWIPRFATDPAGPQFYYATPLATNAVAAFVGPVGVSYRGAEFREHLREGDPVEIEGDVLHVDTNGPSGTWIRALRVQKLSLDPRALPPF